MNTIGRRAAFDQILVDLNTQCDFLLPGGALPVANRAEVLPNVRHLMNWARTHRVAVISSLEAHRHGESSRGMPPHCIDRTLGQRKLPFTLMPSRLILQGDNTSDVPSEPFRKFQQIIFTKRNADFLANPKADRLINSLHANAWILFGVTATHCIKAVALGLLARHHRVVVVRDACGYWSMADGEHAIRQMEAKGALIVTTDEVINGGVTERIRGLMIEEAARQAELAAAALAREKASSSNVVAAVAPALPSPYTKPNGQAKSAGPVQSTATPDESPINGNGNSAADANNRRPVNGRVKKASQHRTSGEKVVPPHLVRNKSRSDATRPKPR